jgi:hypothetical protein
MRSQWWERPGWSWGYESEMSRGRPMPNTDDTEVQGTPIPRSAMLRGREDSDTECSSQRCAGRRC